MHLGQCHLYELKGAHLQIFLRSEELGMNTEDFWINLSESSPTTVFYGSIHCLFAEGEASRFTSANRSYSIA